MTGPCARCGTTPAPVAAYFGPELCHPCAEAAAHYFDKAGRWPPLPPEWQAQLDALGPWPLDVTRPRLRKVDVTATSRAPAPEQCPAGIEETADHAWALCSVCGKGWLVGLTTGEKQKPRRIWPRCYMTPGCTGRHEPFNHEQEKAS